MTSLFIKLKFLHEIIDYQECLFRKIEKSHQHLESQIDYRHYSTIVKLLDA